MDNQPAKRVLIVGWDGATFDLIKPWAEAGYMPHTARLMEAGAHRVLNSTVPTLSPPAWTSFVTGKNPGRHGVFDFIRRKRDSYELESVQNRLESHGTLFHWVGEAGKKVGVVNVPLSYPPERVNGFMVSGLGSAPEWQFTHPPELRETLLAKGYEIHTPVAYNGDNDEVYFQASLATTRKRAEISLELMQTHEWDLFMVVFMNVDQVLTYLYHHLDPTHPRHDPETLHLADGILELHQFLDTTLGRMMEVAGADALTVLASDHGMGPLYKEVFLNNWLQERGYLTLKHSSSGTRQYHEIVRKIGFTRENIWRLIGPARTQAIKRLLPERFHDLVPTTHPTLATQVDWSRTKAYSFGNVGQIYVNLRGREPQGIVNPGDEYDRLIHALTEDLYELTDPDTGEQIVDVVYRKGELYDGPYFDVAPDLNVVMQDYSYVTQMRREMAYHGLTRPLTQMSGFHRREGIFVAKGPNIGTDELPPASIVDVTPTILYLLDLEIPEDMDGGIMFDICTPAYKQAFRARKTHGFEMGEPASIPSHSDEDEAKILERLRELGYLG